MGSFLLAIALLAAMAVALFLGFWVFVPILLVPFFLLFIRGATRRSMRRTAMRHGEVDAPVVTRRQTTLEDVYETTPRGRATSRVPGESAPVGEARGFADRDFHEDVLLRDERELRRPERTLDPSERRPPDTLH